MWPSQTPTKKQRKISTTTSTNPEKKMTEFEKLSEIRESLYGLTARMDQRIEAFTDAMKFVPTTNQASYILLEGKVKELTTIKEFIEQLLKDTK